MQTAGINAQKVLKTSQLLVHFVTVMFEPLVPDGFSTFTRYCTSLFIVFLLSNYPFLQRFV